MKKLLKFIFRVLLCAVLLFAGYAVLGGYRKMRAVMSNRPLETAVAEYTSSENYLTYDRIPSDFVDATVSVEDKRFFRRSGYDFIALGRAILSNIRHGEIVDGGSTIPQQIAKNLYFHFADTSVTTKTAQVFILYQLESHYSKEELFALYANMNYYGDGYYGLYNASKGYFKKDPMDLTLAEAALLAGIVNAPSAYQLSTGYDLAILRQHKVLETMLDNEKITEEQYSDALNETIPKP